LLATIDSKKGTYLLLCDDSKKGTRHKDWKSRLQFPLMLSNASLSPPNMFLSVSFNNNSRSLSHLHARLWMLIIVSPKCPNSHDGEREGPDDLGEQ